MAIRGLHPGDTRMHPSLTAVLRQLSKVAGPDLSDRDLLQRFLTYRDNEAFETLVRKHAAMVFNVCRRVLDDTPDAEDAFQVVFLILACKARSIQRRESVGSWLH